MKAAKSSPSPVRRKLLSWGILGAIGISFGTFLGVFRKQKEMETVKLITADGKVMIVERRHLPRKKGHKMRVSNESLRNWMTGGKS